MNKIFKISLFLFVAIFLNLLLGLARQQFVLAIESLNITINEICWAGTKIEGIESKNYWRYEWLELYNNTEQAISLYEKAIEVIGGNNSRFIKAQIYDRMGDIYNNQDNLIPAMDYYQQAADLYETAGNFEILSLVLYNMGLIKLKQNDYAEGYQLLKKAMTLDEEHGFNNLSGEQDFLDLLEGILERNE